MKKPAAVGIDVGGTKTLCILVDEKCGVLEEIKFKTSPDEGRDQFTETLLKSVKRLERAAGKHKREIAAIGVGFAGLVDEEKLKVKQSPNLVCLENYPVGKHLKEAIPGAKIIIGNDVQLGVYGEHRLGAAVGCAHVIGVFFGTGVGGAAIIGDRLHLGASGLGGQIGCLLAQPVGGREAALSHGIIDRIASKAAIASEALAMASKEWAPFLRKKVGSDMSKVGWGVLRRAIEHGDSRIEEMLGARMRVVGIALSNVVNFLNPEMVVLGGGLIDEMPKVIVPELEKGLREYLVPEVGAALKVKPAKLKGLAVALGAAHKALKTVDL
ncbi:MAG TPA: ROK family protein [Verrucomicrobiae bacterium]|nr:ROK family protein [Verrucomicrobiae bacterium]